MTEEIKPYDTADDKPQAAAVTREIIRAAMSLLALRHGLNSDEQAYEIIKAVSQRGNVKIRDVATHLLLLDAVEQREGFQPIPATAQAPPKTSFTSVGRATDLNRTAVLRELINAVREFAQTPRATVQVVEPIRGGLLIEAQEGFDRTFLDYFSYVDDAGSVCGEALSGGTQTVIEDVSTAGLYDDAGRAVMVGASAICVTSTPLRDDTRHIHGIVSTHDPRSHRVPDSLALKKIEVVADEAGRWLRWHSAVVMPLVVEAVRRRAADA